MFYMHSLILGFPSNRVTDHIDHDRCNNQKSNLRLATQQQNRFNQKQRQGALSQYKGVTRTPSSRIKPWKAQIAKTIDGKLTRFHIGCFATEEQAAIAYDRKARELFGDFAYINLPLHLTSQD
jgi:hypothetical protein